MGGRGANMGTGRIQQITVNMEGYYATYRKEKDGNVYKYEGSMIGDRVPRTLKQIAQASDIEISREEWYKLYLSAGHILP